MTDYRIGYLHDSREVVDLVTGKVLCTVMPYQTPYSPTGWAMRYRSCHDAPHSSHVVALASRDDLVTQAFRVATDVLKGHA